MSLGETLILFAANTGNPNPNFLPNTGNLNHNPITLVFTH